MRRSTFKKANEAVLKAGEHAYRDRKKKKRDFRALWIVRISAAARNHGVNYSTFVRGLKTKKIELDRIVLSELAIHEPKVFEKVVKETGVKA